MPDEIKNMLSVLLNRRDPCLVMATLKLRAATLLNVDVEEVESMRGAEKYQIRDYMLAHLNYLTVRWDEKRLRAALLTLLKMQPHVAFVGGLIEQSVLEAIIKLHDSDLMAKIENFVHQCSTRDEQR